MTTTAEPAETAGEAGESLFSQAMLLLTVTFVTMLYAMTVTIANVSLPQMQGSLSTTPDQIAWIVTFNIVATAIVTPIAGWLAARLGRRRLMIWGIVGFGVSSVLCGLATSVNELVIYRVAQGAFGAPLVPLGQTLLLDGGTGEELFRRGVPDDRQLWSVTALVHDEYHAVLHDVHTAFLQSGNLAR